MVYELSGNFSHCYPLERNGSYQLGELIDNYQGLFVSTGSLDEFPEDVNTHRLRRCGRREELELSHVNSQHQKVACAVGAVPDCCVTVCVECLTIEVSPDLGVNLATSWVSSQGRIVD